MTGATLAAAQRPKTMEWLEDALNKLWEQSIGYYESINFTLADGGQEDAGFYFWTAGCENKQMRKMTHADVTAG